MTAELSLIGRLAAGLIQTTLDQGANETGCARFLVHAMAPDEVLAIVEAVDSDPHLAPRLEICLPRYRFEGLEGVKPEHLTDHATTYLRHAEFHGPNGAGALFASGDIRLPALVHGSQQDGRRGGTPDTAAAAGLAESARLAQARLPLMDRVQALRDEFERALLERVPHAYVLGSGAHRLPNTSSFVVPGISADQLVETLALEGIVIASGSACSSGTTAPSHVLTAMGVDYEDAKAALRVSLSVETSAEELGLALDAIVERALAPA